MTFSLAPVWRSQSSLNKPISVLMAPGSAIVTVRPAKRFVLSPASTRLCGTQGEALTTSVLAAIDATIFTTEWDVYALACGIARIFFYPGLNANIVHLKSRSPQNLFTMLRG